MALNKGALAGLRRFLESEMGSGAKADAFLKRCERARIRAWNHLKRDGFRLTRSETSSAQSWFYNPVLRRGRRTVEAIAKGFFQDGQKFLAKQRQEANTLRLGLAVFVVVDGPRLPLAAAWDVAEALRDGPPGDPGRHLVLRPEDLPRVTSQVEADDVVVLEALEEHDFRMADEPTLHALETLVDARVHGVTATSPPMAKPPPLALCAVEAAYSRRARKSRFLLTDATATRTHAVLEVPWTTMAEEAAARSHRLER